MGFDTVLEYDIDNDSYKYLPSLPYLLKYGTSVRSGSFIYVFGGEINLAKTDRVLRMSLETLDSWEELAPMSEVGSQLMVVHYS